MLQSFGILSFLGHLLTSVKQNSRWFRDSKDALRQNDSH